jgi:hypothetical protein
VRRSIVLSMPMKTTTSAKRPCQLHAVLCEFVPGGFAKKSLQHKQLSRLPTLSLALPPPRCLELVHELLDELHTLDEQLRTTTNRMTASSLRPRPA